MTPLNVPYLERFERCLRTFNPRALSLTRPGISATTVRDALGDLPINCVDELAMFYSWRGGTDFQDGVLLMHAWIVPGFYIENFDRALRCFRQADLPDLFPLLVDGAGGEIGLNVSLGTVVNRMRELPDCDIIYPSLPSFILTGIECFESGAYYFDGEELTVDTSKEESVLRRAGVVWQGES